MTLLYAFPWTRLLVCILNTHFLLVKEKHTITGTVLNPNIYSKNAETHLQQVGDQFLVKTTQRRK